MRYRRFLAERVGPRFAALALLSCSAWPANSAAPPPDGKSLYAPCVVCHQPSAWGSADGRIPSLAGQLSGYLQEQLALFHSDARTGTAMQLVTAHRSLESRQDTVATRKLPRIPRSRPDAGQGTGQAPASRPRDIRPPVHVVPRHRRTRRCARARAPTRGAALSVPSPPNRTSGVAASDARPARHGRGARQHVPGPARCGRRLSVAPQRSRPRTRLTVDRRSVSNFGRPERRLSSTTLVWFGKWFFRFSFLT